MDEPARLADELRRPRRVARDDAVRGAGLVDLRDRLIAAREATVHGAAARAATEPRGLERAGGAGDERGGVEPARLGALLRARIARLGARRVAGRQATRHRALARALARRDGAERAAAAEQERLARGVADALFFEIVAAGLAGAGAGLIADGPPAHVAAAVRAAAGELAEGARLAREHGTFARARGLRRLAGLAGLLAAARGDRGERAERREREGPREAPPRAHASGSAAAKKPSSTRVMASASRAPRARADECMLSIGS